MWCRHGFELQLWPWPIVWYGHFTFLRLHFLICDLGLLVPNSEKAMATHSNTLAWKIPWTEEPGRLQSMGLQSQTWLKLHYLWENPCALCSTKALLLKKSSFSIHVEWNLGSPLFSTMLIPCCFNYYSHIHITNQDISQITSSHLNLLPENCLGCS